MASSFQDILSHSYVVIFSEVAHFASALKAQIKVNSQSDADSVGVAKILHEVVLRGILAPPTFSSHHES